MDKAKRLDRRNFALVWSVPRLVREAFVGKTWKAVGLGLLNLLAVVGVIALTQPMLRRFLSTAGAAVLGIICFATYWAGAKWIEHRRPFELDARRALPEVVAGLALGTALFSLVMIILLVAGVYHPSGWGSAGQLAAGFAFSLLAGVMEEILFRGFLFRLSSKIVGTWGALLFTSVLFGAAHASNPGATAGSALAIALEAGILLGAAYAVTQRLWLPIGLHVGWNFTEGSLFGMTLSGNSMKSGLLAGSLSGPPILTGGGFGPEASVVAVLVCLLVALLFIWKIVKLRRIEPPIWSKSQRWAFAGS
jgi:membrane protease YdiL (CAAX protease family)